MFLFKPFATCTRQAGDYTDLPLNSNISKTVRVKHCFYQHSVKEYVINFLVIFRLIDFALAVF